MFFAHLCEQAGVPPGVVNMINGDGNIGAELAAHKGVDKVAFTGSTAVGQSIRKSTAGQGKKLTLELGGKSAFIVFEDADIDAAVEGAIISKYRNAGQTCVCTNRIFVQESVYDLFIEKFTRAVKLQKIGNGLDEGVTIGPLVEEKAIQFVEGVVKDATSKGAKIVLGGKRFNDSDDSLVYEPTILSDVTKDMDVYKEEIFGPVAPVFKFKTEAEVITYANDTPFGLASYFYGRDYAKIWRIAEAVSYTHLTLPTICSV